MKAQMNTIQKYQIECQKKKTCMYRTAKYFPSYPFV